MSRSVAACGLIVWLLLGAHPGLGAVWPEDAVLISQAESCLEELDQGRYEEAWEQGSPLFKGLNSVTVWKARQEILRTAYGDLTSRQLRVVKLRTTYRHSPDGSYAIIQFDSSFAAKKRAVETVVLDCSTLPACLLREYILQ